MASRAVSASQIETFKACKRKWAHRAIDKVEAPPHASAATGTLIHSQFERYLKGESLDYSTPALRNAAERAVPGIVNLPPPLSPGMRVEAAFSFETHGGILFRGFIDVIVPDSIVVPGLAGGAPCVIDHKSTSSFNWAKTPASLATDTQAMIYAYEAMRTYKATTVDLLWNYVATKTAPATRRVHLRVVRDHVVEQFLGPIAAVARDINATYELKPRVLDLPPSLDQCDAYGGCPYKALCTDLHSGPLGHLTPEESTAAAEMFPQPKDAPMTQSGVDLFAKLENANAKEEAAPMPVGITNAPADWTAPSFLTAPAASMFPPAMPTVAINPPEWQPPPTPEQRAAAATEAPPPAAKRARRTKAQMAADALVAEVPRHVETGDGDYLSTEPKTIPAPPPPARDTVPAPAGFTLYVDCMPTHGDYVEASFVFSEAKALVNTELSVKDYRFVDYGKGQGAFLIAVNHVMDKQTADIVLDSRTPEAMLCMSDLVARANLVVRGFR